MDQHLNSFRNLKFQPKQNPNSHLKFLFQFKPRLYLKYNLTFKYEIKLEVLGQFKCNAVRCPMLLRASLDKIVRVAFCDFALLDKLLTALFVFLPRQHLNYSVQSQNFDCKSTKVTKPGRNRMKSSVKARMACLVMFGADTMQI